MLGGEYYLNKDKRRIRNWFEGRMFVFRFGDGLDCDDDEVLVVIRRRGI